MDTINKISKLSIDEEFYVTSTPSQLAIKNSNIDEVIESLLEAKTDITAINEEVENCLHFCCKINNIHLLRLFLQHSKITKSDVNQQNAQAGDAPLHIAVKNRSTAQIKLLLDHGADPNLTNYQRNSAFHESFFAKNIEIINLFLKYKVSLSQVNKYGYNALHLAVSECNYSVLLRLLNVKVFDVNKLTLLYHQTPLHLLLWKNENQDVMVLAMARLLVVRGADIHAVDKRNETPLYYAVSSKNLKAVKYLASLGVEIRSAKNCKSIVAAAVRNGDVEMIEYLIGQGVEIDVTNDKFDGMLHVAIKCIKDEKLRFGIVKFLLDKGVKIDDDNETLREHTLLQLAMRHDDVKLFNFLLEEGASMNATNNKGETILYTAVTCYNFEAAKTLIGKGCSLSYMDYNKEASVLSLVVSYKNVELVKLLLTNGTDPGDKKALITAASEGYIDVLKTILDFSAKMDNKSLLMYDVFVAAVEKQRLNIVEYLLNIGVDVNHKPDGNLLLMEHASRRYNDKRCETIVCTLIKEIAYLVFFRKLVHEDNLKMIELRPWRAEYYDKCQRELESMKKRKVCASSDVTYFDVLVKCNNGSVKFLRNQRLCEALGSSNWKSTFEIYNGKLEVTYRNALERMRKVEQFKQVLIETIGLIIQNDDVIDRISEYYDDEDHADCLKYC